MMVAAELVDRFRTDLRLLWPQWDQPSAKLGLAVSGGGDSLALLLLAHAVLPGRIEAATIDHGLRAESPAEAEFVARCCAVLKIPHRVHPVEIGKGNLQARARAARYAVLSAWCDERDLQGLATGHQLDDQVETIVMRLNRGSGVAGLAGIRAFGMVPGTDARLMRPLLGWRREELAAIVRRAGWAAVRDPSNEDLSFDRVRIRQALASADWLDPLAMARSARLLGEADMAIRWAIGREYNEHVSKGSGEATYYALRSGVGGTLVRGGVVRAIFRELGAELGGAEAADLVRILIGGGKSNVAGIAACVRDIGKERAWIFAPENPRRTRYPRSPAA